MRNVVLMPTTSLVVGLTMLLAGCGDSHPIATSAPATSSAVGAPAGSAPAYVPSTGTFAAVSADALAQSSQPSGKCNLDAIDGAPAGSKPLAHGQSALFAGWAAANDAKSVPGRITLLLLGSQDFAVQASSGAPRPDVAAANQEPLLAKSGYVVKADLSAVPAGSYKLELRYDAGGKAWHCETSHTVNVQ